MYVSTDEKRVIYNTLTFLEFLIDWFHIQILVTDPSGPCNLCNTCLCIHIEIEVDWEMVGNLDVASRRLFNIIKTYYLIMARNVGIRIAIINPLTLSRILINIASLWRPRHRYTEGGRYNDGFKHTACSSQVNKTY